jgi:hypothetical protein
MKAPNSCFARALCMLVLAVQITACGDDDDGPKSAAESDDDSRSGAVEPDQTRPRGRDTDDSASAGSGGGGDTVLTETTCLAGASRFPQASPECLGCVCKTIAECGAACQELLLCTLTHCIEELGNGVSVVACALENCAAQASAPGAAIGLTEAAMGLGACRQACVPPPPAPDASTPDIGDDAGATDGADAGVE